MTALTQVYESGVVKNADGLRVKYGTAEALKAVAGTVASKDDERYLYVEIDWTRLPKHAAAGTGTIYGSEPECAIPTGAIITAATLTYTVAFAGTGATLNIGLVDRNSGPDDTLAEYIFEDLAVAGMTPAGDIDTSVGTAIEYVTTAPLYIWTAVETADFTAGHARLKVTYFMPRTV